jgi:hypothetical protein
VTRPAQFRGRGRAPARARVAHQRVTRRGCREGKEGEKRRGRGPRLFLRRRQGSLHLATATSESLSDGSMAPAPSSRRSVAPELAFLREPRDEILGRGFFQRGKQKEERTCLYSEQRHQRAASSSGGGRHDSLPLRPAPRVRRGCGKGRGGGRGKKEVKVNLFFWEPRGWSVRGREDGRED